MFFGFCFFFKWSSAAVVVLLTFKQLSERFGTRGGNWEGELVHGNSISYSQGVNLPVGHLSSQQLPQQDPETRRESERRASYHFPEDSSLPTQEKKTAVVNLYYIFSFFCDLWVK